MKEFKIRCSQIGKIMTNGRGKNAGMGQTAKTYCETWLKEQIYNRRNEFSSKYTDKGNECEEDSIDFIADYLDLGFAIKNEQFFENDFMCGTPDILQGDLVIDAKNSWDCFSFPLFESDISNKDYWYQLQGYMALTDRNKAKLIYVLSNTPEHLIEAEARRFCFKNGLADLDEGVFEKCYNSMTYDNIKSKHRIKIFDIERDDKIIESIELRVNECREYIKSLIY